LTQLAAILHPERMSMAASFADLLSVDRGNRNVIRLAWDRLHHLPGGKALFSKLIGRAAPYTGTIDARVVEVSAHRARVLLEDRPGVRNHLRCVHAIALVNLAELAGNVAVAYALPDDARFIVAGLSIEYLKKARGTIEATTELDVTLTSERREIQVPVSLRNQAGEEVARATLRTLIGPKK
jgi:acyl-coenzyme A thioesterase PaaI-like protein